MKDILKASEIVSYFGHKPFTSNDLYAFYVDYEPNLKKTTFRWRVYKLKNSGVINTLKKGVYTVTSKKDFEPIIDNKLIAIYMKVKEQFPYTNMAIWETSWLNNYIIHQTFSSNIILEVEKEAATIVFDYLRDTSRDVYLNPGKLEIEKYIVSGENNVFIKNLTKTSPLIERDGIKIPKLEKIIVDVFMDDEMFIAYQGAELKNMFQFFFRTFNINQSTLNQYANKRHVREKLISFLEDETDIDDELLVRGKSND